MGKPSQEELRKLRLRASRRKEYKPSGALKMADWLLSQTVRAPRRLRKPLFYATLAFIDMTPIGQLARLDLLVERLQGVGQTH